MEKENDKKILSEEELKEVEGGGRFRAPKAYCEAHLTMESCHGTGLCRWYSDRRWDDISQQWVDGYCYTL